MERDHLSSVTQSWLFGCVHTLRRLGGSSSVVMFFGVLFGLDFNRAFHGVCPEVPATSCTHRRGNGATVCNDLPIALLEARWGCPLVLLQSVFTGTDRTGVVGSLASIFRIISKNTSLRPGRPVRQTHQAHRTSIANQDAPGAHLILRTHRAHT